MALNVAGAFKVLIEAQPDKALAAFDAVLKSTKNASSSTVTWADTVTALNSAYQLTTGIISGVASVAKTAAGAFVSVGSGMIELLTKGGDLQEQFGQYEIMAANFGQDANGIIDSIQRITDNTIGWKDQTKLATKAIAAGLSRDELDLAFQYVKKFTEATGEEFGTVAEKVTDAFAKNKFKSLQELGFDVGKKTTATDILNQMSAGLTKFGDAGFNAGDKFLSISNSLDLFIAKIGQALNASPALQAALTSLADSAIGFVNGFGEEKRKSVTDFFDSVVQGSILAGQSIIGWMGLSGISLDKVFTDGAKKGKSFLSGLVQGLEYTAVTFAKMSNVGLEALNLVKGGWLNLKVIALSVMTSVADFFEWSMQFIFASMSKQVSRIASVLDFITPDAFAQLGIETGIIDGIKGAAEALRVMSNEENNSAKMLRDSYEKAIKDDAKWENFTKSMTISVDSIVSQSKRAQAAIAAIPEGKLAGFKEIYNGESFAAKMKDATPKADTMGGRLLFDSAEGGPKGTLSTETAQLTAAQVALTQALNQAAGVQWIHRLEIQNADGFVTSLIDDILTRAGVRAKAEAVQVPGL